MRKVFGVGINDLPGWSNWKTLGKHNLKYRLYVLWKSVLTRCFSKRYQETHPTYKDCKVCEAWLKLSGFVNDIKTLEGYQMWADNPSQQIALDKDLKSNGEKLYSAETCMFLSAQDNCKEMMKRCKQEIKRKSLPALLEYNKKMAKKIKCVYPDGEVRIFENTQVLTKAGFNRRHVYSCCYGERKLHKKCSFSFA